jgi:MFS superfamily sulfate permease-like transporter
LPRKCCARSAACSELVGCGVRLGRGDESFPGLLLLRPEGPIFFANAAQIAHKIEPLVREAQPKVVAVDASGVLDMEYTVVKMFAQLAKRQSRHGVELWLIGMTPRVLAIIQRSPLGQLLGREGMHFNLEIAVARYLDGAGPEKWRVELMQ